MEDEIAETEFLSVLMRQVRVGREEKEEDPK
jgi:hypothetical protein